MKDLRNKFTITSGPNLVYEDNTPRSMEQAFAISIAKWRLIVDIIKTRSIAIDADNQETCGLCLKYFGDDWDLIRPKCLRCPIALKMGTNLCQDTPFMDYINAWKQSDVDSCLKHARRELAFLKKLAAKYGYELED